MIWKKLSSKVQRMITLDTNVLIRILVDDPENKKQNEIARKVVHRYKEFYIPQVVQVELAWVLSRSYKLHKDTILIALHELIENVVFNLESQEVFEKAIHYYQHHNIDFSDSVSHESSKLSQSKKVLTFDKKFSQVPGVTLLK